MLRMAVFTWEEKLCVMIILLVLLPVLPAAGGEASEVSEQAMHDSIHRMLSRSGGAMKVGG